MWTLLILFTLFIVVFFIYEAKRRSIFANMGIPGPKAEFLLGNLRDIYNQVSAIKYKSWTAHYGPVFGYYEGAIPVMVVSDVDMVQDIFAKKFSNFHMRRYVPLRHDSDTDKRAQVFSAHGIRWKRLRSITSPSFASGHLKMITPVLTESSEILLKRLVSDSDNGVKPINIFPGGMALAVASFLMAALIHRSISEWHVFHHYYQEFTLDVIAKIALGESRNMQGMKDNPYIEKLQIIFGPPPMAHYFFSALPELKPLLLPLLRWLTSNPTHSIVHKMDEIVTERRANPEKYADRQDFVNSFLDAAADDDTMDSLAIGMGDNKKAIAMNKLEVDKRLTNVEVAMNCFLFVAAGFDTTANSLAYMTYLLATHPDVQEKLLKECTYYLTFDILTVIDQLRSAVSRQCASACKVGGANGGPSVEVPKGMNISVDLMSVHTDPKLWGDDANEFKPERFMPGAPPRHPMAWIPFGAGPRQCLGMRLALLEARLALAVILRKYKFEQCDQTEAKLNLIGGLLTFSPEKVTVKITPRAA